MFTWICPQCGREVPPAYNDCPNCSPQSVPPGNPVQPQPVEQRPIPQQPGAPRPVPAAPPPPPPPAPEYAPPAYQPAPPVYQPSPAHSFLGQGQTPPPPR